jgi:atypical dual specificity phosphatase
MITSLYTSLHWATPPKSGYQTFVKKTKYIISLLYNRVMNLFCRRKWWHSIEGLKEKKITVGALPLKRRLFKNDLDRMKALGIQAVLILVEPFELKRGIAGNPVTPEDLKNDGIESLFLPTPDFKPLTLNTLHQGADFIDKITRQGKRILVHCKAGRGRSVAVVCAYLMKYHSDTFKTADDAIGHVRKFRSHISLQFKQRAVLIEFQQSLQKPSPLS